MSLTDFHEHPGLFFVWATILLHLFLLFGLTTIFLYAVEVSAPLVILRVPLVRRWWDAARRAGRHRVLRGAAALVLVAVFAAGYVPLARELAEKGGATFIIPDKRLAAWGKREFPPRSF